MRKIYFFFAAMIVFVGAAAMSVNSLKSPDNKPIKKTSATIIPNDVATILQNSCTDCHSAGGNGMAESMWSYSSWDKYSVKKQSKKAKAICNAIKNGMMPPSYVRQSNPSKIPTMEQSGIICNWSSSLSKK